MYKANVSIIYTLISSTIILVHLSLKQHFKDKQNYKIYVVIVTLAVAFVTRTVLRLPHFTVHLHCSVDHRTVSYVSRTGVLITALYRSYHALECSSPHCRVRHPEFVLVLKRAAFVQSVAAEQSSRE
jgi:hypothetical protein